MSVRTGAGDDIIRVHDVQDGAQLSLVGQGSDQLVSGMSDGNWSITSQEAGQIDSSDVDQPIVFSGMPSLVGGKGDDNFAFANGQGISGSLDGGGGQNSLDYIDWQSGVYVNLVTGAATGVDNEAENRVTGIQNVQGGLSDDILVGNHVDNVLRGLSGRDLLIGGLGADTLEGHGNQDILIGGHTDHDTNRSNLETILNAWTYGGHGYTTRVNYLRGTPIVDQPWANGPRLNGDVFLQAGTTVHDDGAVDILMGDSQQDWFFAGPDDVHDRGYLGHSEELDSI